MSGGMISATSQWLTLRLPWLDDSKHVDVCVSRDGKIDVPGGLIFTPNVLGGVVPGRDAGAGERLRRAGALLALLADVVDHDDAWLTWPSTPSSVSPRLAALVHQAKALHATLRYSRVDLGVGISAPTARAAEALTEIAQGTQVLTEEGDSLGGALELGQLQGAPERVVDDGVPGHGAADIGSPQTGSGSQVGDLAGMLGDLLRKGGDLSIEELEVLLLYRRREGTQVGHGSAPVVAGVGQVASAGGEMPAGAAVHDAQARDAGKAGTP